MPRVAFMDWDDTVVIGSCHVMDELMASRLRADDGKNIKQIVASLGTIDGFEYGGSFNFHKLFRAINMGLMDPELLEQCFKNFAQSRDEILAFVEGDEFRAGIIEQQISKMNELLGQQPPNPLGLLECFWHVSAAVVTARCGIDGDFFALLKNSSAGLSIVTNTLREQDWIDFEVRLYDKVRLGDGTLRDIMEEERELLNGLIDNPRRFVGTTMDDSKAAPERVGKLFDRMENMGITARKHVQTFVVGDSLSDLQNALDARVQSISTCFICVTAKCADQESRDRLIGSVNEAICSFNEQHPSQQIEPAIFVNGVGEIGVAMERSSARTR